MSDPIFPFDVWTQQIVQASVPANRNALRSQILGSTITSLTEPTQPETPVDGALYVIPAGATGPAWDMFEPNDLAIFVDGAWYAFAPVLGLVLPGPEGEVVFTEAGWVPYSATGGATVFTQLGDVPASYTGQEGRLVAVNDTGDGLVFVESVPGGSESFTDLNDTPGSYEGQAGRVPVVNSTEDGLEFADFPTPPVSLTEFIELTDTPEEYTGNAGRLVAVNGTEDGLEFVEVPTPEPGSSSFIDLTDTPEDYAGAAGYKLVVNAGEDGVEFVPDTSSGVDWLAISDDFTEPTEASATGDRSMAIGPGATVTQSAGASAQPMSAGTFGPGAGGYLSFSEGPLPFSVGQTVELSGFPGGEVKTYGSYGLSDPGDPATVVLDDIPLFQVGDVLTVESAQFPSMNGDYTIIGRPSSQSVTLGDGFAATDEEAMSATYTGLEPNPNGQYQVTQVYFSQINIDGFDFELYSLPPEALVTAVPQGGSIAIGPGATANGDRSIALGSTADRDNSVDVGGRVITGLNNPTESTDAVNLGYFDQNVPFVERQITMTGNFDASQKESRFNELMYQDPSSGGFYDGKVVAYSPGTGAVSSWRISFLVTVDANDNAVVSAWSVDPVSVDPSHSGVYFEAVEDTEDQWGPAWKWVYSDSGSEPTAHSVTVRRTTTSYR